MTFEGKGVSGKNRLDYVKAIQRNTEKLIDDYSVADSLIEVFRDPDTKAIRPGQNMIEKMKKEMRQHFSQ